MGNSNSTPQNTYSTCMRLFDSLHKYYLPCLKETPHDQSKNKKFKFIEKYKIYHDFREDELKKILELAREAFIFRRKMKSTAYFLDKKNNNIYFYLSDMALDIKELSPQMHTYIVKNFNNRGPNYLRDRSNSLPVIGTPVDHGYNNPLIPPPIPRTNYLSVATRIVNPPMPTMLEIPRRSLPAE